MLNESLKTVIGTALILSALGSVSYAASPLSFSEEAIARGVNHTIAPIMQIQFGPGLGLLDLDGDEDLDIILAGANGGVVHIYENDGTGNFTDRTSGSNILPITSSGIAAADYDNDGDQDIFIGGWLSSSKLYRNDGNFVFTDVSAAAGVDIVTAAMAASWGDYNLDGHMDLYASARTNTSLNTQLNSLFRNNGDGTFTDVAVALGVSAEQDPTLVSSFFDYDRDGDDDLYLGTDKGSGQVWSNRLYRNDGGTFTEITAAANAFAYVDCMGIAIADLNNDSFFDIYVTDVTTNKLFMQDGSGVLVDETANAGVVSGVVGWGAVFADFDNDSFSDLYVCSMAGPNRLYRGESVLDWPMADDASAAGVDLSGVSYSVAVGDVNNDGLLDMLVGHVNSPAKLFINQSADAANNHMIRLKPIGNETNQLCVGACFSVYANGKWQVSEARSGVNYKASEGRILQVGLGPDTEAQVIDVVWPGGVIRQLTGAPADRTWSIYDESRLGDPNNDGVIDWSERNAAQAAWTGPGIKIEPGVEIYDIDGDFDIDDDDIAAMTPCPADLNGDGFLDFFDVSYFLTNTVNYNGDAGFDFFDVSQYLQDFAAGCP